MDRIFRSPGPLRGHVVDFLQLPYWPIFNVADMCISAAAVLIMILAVIKGVGIGGERYAKPAPAPPPTNRRLMGELKVVLVPDGLDGERVDTAMARMLGLSRQRSADLIGRGQVRLDGREVAKSERAHAGAMLEVELDAEPRPSGSFPGGRRVWASCTTTTTSW